MEQNTSRLEEFKIYLDIIRDAFWFSVRDTKQRVSNTANVVTGNVQKQDQTCQIKNCVSQSIGVFPRQKQWKDDVNVCRRHWILLHTGIRMILGLFILFILSIPFGIRVILG